MPATATWADVDDFKRHVATIEITPEADTNPTVITEEEVQQALDLGEARVRAWMCRSEPPWSMTQEDDTAVCYLKRLVLLEAELWWLGRLEQLPRKGDRRDDNREDEIRKELSGEYCAIAGINPKTGAKDLTPCLPGGVTDTVADAQSGRLITNFPELCIPPRHRALRVLWVRLGPHQQ